MRNTLRLKQLGIPALVNIVANKNPISHDKNKPNHRNSEDSESEHDPSHDDTSEGDLFDDDSAKGSKESNKRTRKRTNKRTADMPPGVKPWSKRVFADNPTTRTTRSKIRIAQPDACLTPSGIRVPPPSVPTVSQAREVVGNFDRHTQSSEITDGLAQFDGSTHMVNGGDAIACHDGHNQILMSNEDDGLAQLDDNTHMVNGGEGITQPGGHNQMATEGGNERLPRGINMGKGLQRLNRSRRGKLPVIISEGRTRPVVPLVAAKFATECNIAVRNHLPVFKHWKDYKDTLEASPVPPTSNKLLIFLEIKFHIRVLSSEQAKFDINTNDEQVKKACSEMMKAAVHQQRYRLKKMYFDPLPLHLVRRTSPIKSMNDQLWNDLVEYWKSPKKMDTCQKNKDNRGRVKFHQTTGSRSYMVTVENLGDKYIDQEPNALDLFKECHYSKKKKGFTAIVQSSITQMENKLSASIEGEEPKSTTQVVADVLAENTKKNQFLQNVGMQNVQPRSSVQDIEAELEAEKRANAKLRSIVNTQREKVDELSKQVHETEQARIKDQEEMKKKQAEMDAKLELVLSQIRS